jgi:hypothetical protein
MLFLFLSCEKSAKKYLTFGKLLLRIMIINELWGELNGGNHLSGAGHRLREMPHGEENAGSDLPAVPGNLPFLPMPEWLRPQSVQFFYDRAVEKITFSTDFTLDKEQKFLKL